MTTNQGGLELRSGKVVASTTTGSVVTSQSPVSVTLTSTPRMAARFPMDSGGQMLAGRGSPQVHLVDQGRTNPGFFFPKTSPPGYSQMAMNMTPPEFDEKAAMETYADMGKKLRLDSSALAQFVIERTDSAKAAYEARLRADKQMETMLRQQHLQLQAQEQLHQEEMRCRKEELALQRDQFMMMQTQMQEQQSHLDSTLTRLDTEGNKERDDYKLSLPRMQDDEDIDFFLLHYENICAPRRWDDFKKVSRLVPLLSGKARKAYNELLKGNSNPSYVQVKQAILEEYRLTSEHYRRQFRSITKNQDENFKQFGRRQKLMFDRWFEVLDIDKEEPGKVIEVFMLEQFMGTLAGELALHVKEKQPTTAKEAAEYAFIHLEAKKEVELDRKARGSNGFGASQPKHLWRTEQLKAEEKGTGSVNFKNASTGDRAKKVAEFVKKMKPEKKTELIKANKCFKCEKTGHSIRTCTALNAIHLASTSAGCDRSPSKDTEKLEGRDPLWAHLEPLCDQCEKINWRRDLQVRVDGKVVGAMRDTGADDLYIRPEHVSKDNYLGTTEKVVLADLKIQGEYPRALVDLDSPFVKGLVQCVVIKDLGVDVFIGDRLRFADGSPMDNVPVYPKKGLLAVTRAQAKKEAQPHEPVPVQVINELDVTPEQLRKLQEGDSSLQRTREAARTGKEVSRDGKVSFTFAKGVLKRVYGGEKGKHTQVVVPKPLRRAVLKLGHDTPMTGHMGAKRMKERIWGNFYWPGMCQDIRRYCISCDRCQKITPRGRVSKTLLGKMHIPQVPFEKVGVDLIGSIKPASNAGCRYAASKEVRFGTRLYVRRKR
ncbi:uncharacterized protein [Littorina saxatilis]|uniref:uncharacterized protein n=1 Tax=Littorina saxatilis TaxID=31220 RepID=UPI0038B65710